MDTVIEKELFWDSFVESLKYYGLETDLSKEKFTGYFETLVSENRNFNLIGNLNAEKIAEYLFADSLLFFKAINNSAGLKIIDIGSGGGFPGIPLKMADGRIDLSVLDSSEKKINFLKNASAQTDLTDISFYNERIEIFARLPEFEEFFDIAVVKGFGVLSVIVETCSKIIKIGGRTAAWKGNNLDKEMKEIEAFLPYFGIGSFEIFNFPAKNGGNSSIVVLTKTSETPKEFPRTWKAITTRPLDIFIKSKKGNINV